MDAHTKEPTREDPERKLRFKELLARGLAEMDRRSREDPTLTREELLWMASTFVGLVE